MHSVSWGRSKLQHTFVLRSWASCWSFAWCVGFSSALAGLFLVFAALPAYAAERLVPVSVSGSSYYSNYSPQKAFDGNLQTVFVGHGAYPMWLEVDLGADYVLTRYEIYHEPFAPLTAPKTWAVKVSAQGNSWSDVDSRSGIVNWGGELVGRAFSVSSSVPGRFLRFEFAESVNAVTEMDIREIFLFGDRYTAPIPSPSPSSSPSPLPSSSPSPTPAPGQTTNPDGSIDVRVNVGVRVDPVEVRMPSSVDLVVPIIQDPAWLPVWEKGISVAIKVAFLLVLGWFFGRVV